MWFKSNVTIPAVAAISFCLVGGTVPAPAYADLGDQLFKLLPDDGAAFARFGSSVAISGAIAIVGARNDEDFSGSAYLFDISDPKNPVQLAKLKADDRAEGDEFGHSIAISASIAIIAAPENDDNGSLSGSAYLFDISDPKNPVQIAKLLPNDGAAGDYFGGSVGIFGATALVGAGGDAGQSGSAYLFDISDPSNPVQTAKLVADDGAVGDSFGWGAAISAAIAVVGAIGQDDNGDGETAGSAYLFDVSDPRNPVQLAKLLPDDGALSDEFGYSVAISGNTAIVGAWLDDDNGNKSGSAYLFDAAVAGKCPWDLDGCGSVGASDLLSLLTAWGTDPGGPPDFDGDGDVDDSDLAALLANWGPCP